MAHLCLSIGKFLPRIFLAAVLLLLSACAPAENTPRQANLPTLTVGIDTTAVSALIMIADNQGYFTNQGIKVNIKTYPSGLAAVQGMLNNEVDVATAAEFVLVGQAFEGAPLQAWASIDKFMHNYLIARKDRGIERFSDLRGKQVGVPFKTAAQFYLGRLLELNGMSYGDINPVNLRPTEVIEALTAGRVDAVVAWQPNAKMITDQLGSAVIRWPAQSNQAAYAVLISTEQWTKQHTDSVDRFLKALVDAESFYASRPQDARSILQKRLSYDDAYIAAIWPEHQFQVALDQSLILAMEDEARWMIQNKLVQDQQSPAFLNYVYLSGLKGVRPDAVNIIH